MGFSPIFCLILWVSCTFSQISLAVSFFLPIFAAAYGVKAIFAKTFYLLYFQRRITTSKSEF